MAHKKNCTDPNCTCRDGSIIVPTNFSNDPEVCPPDTEQCTEVFDMACICYNGADICELDIRQGDRLDEVLQKLVLTAAQLSCAQQQPSVGGPVTVFFQDSGAAQPVANTMGALPSGDLVHTISSGSGTYRITAGFNFVIQPSEFMYFEPWLNGGNLNDATFEKFSNIDDNYHSFTFMKVLTLNDSDNITMAFSSPNDVVAVNSFLLIEKIN